MGLKRPPLWGKRTNREWVQKIDEILGPNCHYIHVQGPDYPDREPDPEKRAKLVRDIYLQMLGALVEIVWQMKENECDEKLIEQAEELVWFVTTCDVTDREVRIAIQELVNQMHLC